MNKTRANTHELRLSRAGEGDSIGVPIGVCESDMTMY